MFILVEGLNATGWVDRLAWWLGSGVRGSVWAALFAVGSFSVLLANLANNQVRVWLPFSHSVSTMKL
jgi:Na+/H+ antiporter NhaD/arsenite permease-like protein